ncbi:MAG: hypothetical protein AAFV19_23100 [Pseudomonadota bacterium]
MADPVRHRVAFYFSGYDIAGVERYHTWVQRQTTYYARRFGVRFKVSALDRETTLGPDFPCSVIEADWGGTKVHTTLYFWDWRDVMIREYRRPRLARLTGLLTAFGRQLLSGQWRRIARAGPLFFWTIGLPVWLVILRVIFLVTGATQIGPALSGDLTGLIATAICAALLWGSLWFGKTYYEKFFACYIVFLDKLLRGQETVYAEKLSRAIGTTTGAVRDTAPDEALFIGHSFGSVAAAQCYAAALAHPPGQTPLSFLTVGSLLPAVALSPDEQPTRTALDQILTDDKTTWMDVYAPQDAFNFPQTQPLRDFGLPRSGAQPMGFEVRPAVFGEIVSPRKIRKFRWNFLRMHFQFLMANDKAGAFDYIRYLTGPEPLRAQFGR